MASAEAPVSTGAQPVTAASAPETGPIVPQSQPAVWVSDTVVDRTGSLPTEEAPSAEVVSSPSSEQATPAPKEEPEPAKVEKETLPQPTKVALDEPEVERRVQSALTKARQKWEREQAEAEAKRQEQQREEAAAAAHTRAEAEEAELYQRWQQGDTEAESQLMAKYGDLLKNKYSEEQRKARELLQAQETTARRQLEEFGVQKWREHAQSFGADPDEDEFIGENSPKDMRALNALLLKRTKDEAIVAAMRENPQVTAWVEELKQQHQKELDAIKKEMETAIATGKQAAALDTQARLIGNGQIPDADVSTNAGGGPQTEIEKLRAFNDDPGNPVLYKWFTEVYNRKR